MTNHERGRLVAWNEPLCGREVLEGKLQEEHHLNVVAHAREKDIIDYWRATHTRDKYKGATDEQLLEDFMTVYWAWFVDE